MFPLTCLYCTALFRQNHFKKPAKEKDVMTNPLKESHYVLFLFIPLAVITVATVVSIIGIICTIKAIITYVNDYNDNFINKEIIIALFLAS